MALAFGCAPALRLGRTHSSIRTTRKIGILGAHTPSLADAPWTDPSWELHGHASAHSWYRREIDFYYDLHPPSCWTRGGKKTALYPKWLAKNTVPIYMQKHYPEVPASIPYPKGRILTEFGFPRPYFTNHVAWIIALALTEGVSTIGLFGINYGILTEYQIQRACCEYWIGRAVERGVHIIIPEQSTLLREPAKLYGYESHDEETGRRLPEYREKVWKPHEDITPVVPGQPAARRAEPTKEIKAEIELEEMECPRPEWSFGPLPDKTNGGCAAEEV